METNRYNIREVLNAIMDLIDKDSYSTDCGADFQGEACSPCKYYTLCAYGEQQTKEAKHCREMIKRLQM